MGILKALLNNVGQNQSLNITKSVKTIISYVIELANTEALVEILITYKDKESNKNFLDDEQMLFSEVKTDKPDLLKILYPYTNNEGRHDKNTQFQIKPSNTHIW